MDFTSKHRKKACAAGAVGRKSETTANAGGSCHHPRALRMHTGGLCPVLSPALGKWAGQCQLATKYQGQKLGSERITSAGSLPVTVKKKKRKHGCVKRGTQTKILMGKPLGGQTPAHQHQRQRGHGKERRQMERRWNTYPFSPKFIVYIIFFPQFLLIKDKCAEKKCTITWPEVWGRDKVYGKLKGNKNQ